MSGGWQFWVDRGGTFTDVVALNPTGEVVVHKLLTENPEHYQDSTIQGIADVLGPLAAKNQIDCIKVGTTVATNALLERKGEPTLLVITKGFADALRIGYQNRPNIFAQHIILPTPLYSWVIEADERINASGEILAPLDFEKITLDLRQAFADGFRSCAIVLMHGYRYYQHELAIEKIAMDIGFTNVSTSHKIIPLMKLVGRGDTTVADAYLSPILNKYVKELSNNLPKSNLLFMQSNGGLSEASHFRGKDSLLSGPAGGIVGAVKTSQEAGFNKIISFDMGGTSTDVSHYDGRLERTQETEISGIRIRVPMMDIHTVAAGGGSILHFDGQRYRVGPDSAGANPGPACYRKNGPLTVTDCNVLLGKLQPGFFPSIFGPDGEQSIDTVVVQNKFKELASDINKSYGDNRAVEQIAEGFLSIAVQKMANAIKKISIERGHDVSEYALCCFGGAGGQHACLIADALGIKTIFIHNYAGVLSAYGIGLADLSAIYEQSIEIKLADDTNILKVEFEGLEQKAADSIRSQQVPFDELVIQRKAFLRYDGSDNSLPVDFADINTMRTSFETKHERQYGFKSIDKPIIIESIAVEAIGIMHRPTPRSPERKEQAGPETSVQMFTNDKWHETPIFKRENLPTGSAVNGPAIIVDATGTTIVEPHWSATLTPDQHLTLSTRASLSFRGSIATEESGQRFLANARNDKRTQYDKADPVKLELFNSLFMSIAENMGVTLQNTSHSVNIKERLDFSCALFDPAGNLIANAPHIPVHLGSMGESVRSILTANKTLQPGDVYALNNPYNGGTHLPDITVVTPVFADGMPIFFVASRAHHADIGGITPGSMPPHSKSIDEEGVLIDNFLLVRNGVFREQEFSQLLTSNKYPVRNVTQNLADIQAQIAANEKGVQELHQMVLHYGLETVHNYMRFVQDNAEEMVRAAISKLSNGTFSTSLDDGSRINITLTVDHSKRNAVVDFTGTSNQQLSNFNAPSAITKAAVLYVFRTLVDDDIPLNEGCMKPLQLIIPEGSLLSPKHPAAVVAGNVETSQAIVDTLYGAMGILAACQGTMNNFTFGNERYQYYETICGGSGAGPTFNGTDAVHTHMTNSRLTDPEVLEWRYPVLIEQFSIRKNSCGTGRHRGGNGVIRRIKFNENMTASILSNRRAIAPFGLNGGGNAVAGRNYVIRQSGGTEMLSATATTEMMPGDVFVIETPGGGGYGSL